jgi:tripartite-type tricarboxylate transporter receptor subunit TctC
MDGTNNSRRRVAGLLLGSMAWALAARPAFGQAFPDRPIRVVVPYPPGGPNDLLGRLLVAGFAEHWGVAAFVDNKPGGAGIIGGEMVTHAKPDGYTLLIVTPSSTTINVSLMPNKAFDPVKELAPITTLATGIYLLVVNPATPVRSTGELIALTRRNPGMTFGSAGIGSGGHLAGELFKSMAGVEMTHAAYKGGAPAVADLLGGHIDMMIADSSVAAPLVRSGKLRALAVSSATRSRAFPELPTIAESGVPGYEAISWFGVAAPAGTPEPIVAALNAEALRLIATPEYRSKLDPLGLEPAGITPQAFRAMVQQDVAKWAQVIKDSGARAE